MADIGSTWTTFLTQMVGLSVAAERVTETVKQWVTSAPANLQQAARRAWIVQSLAIVSGVLVVVVSGANPLNINAKFGWIVTGVLVSGGSAFWNHLLDMVKAAKIQKEDAANTQAAAAGQAPIPS